MKSEANDTRRPEKRGRLAGFDGAWFVRALGALLAVAVVGWADHGEAAGTDGLVFAEDDRDDIMYRYPDGRVESEGTDTLQALGQATDYDNDGTLEIPYISDDDVDDSGTDDRLRAIEILEDDLDNETTLVDDTINGKKYGRIVSGDLDGDAYSDIVYESPQGGVWKYEYDEGKQKLIGNSDLSGNPWMFMDIEDTDGDGANEIWWIDEGTNVKYAEKDGSGNWSEEEPTQWTETPGSNRKSPGIGPAQNFAGEGFYWLMVDGSQNPGGLTSDVTPHSYTSFDEVDNDKVVYKSPITAADITGDSDDEIVMVSKSDDGGPDDDDIRLFYAPSNFGTDNDITEVLEGEDPDDDDWIDGVDERLGVLSHACPSVSLFNSVLEPDRIHSRTVSQFTNFVDRSDTGQYRFFSGARPRKGTHWKGTLVRQFKSCNTTDVEEVDFGAQLEDLIVSRGPDCEACFLDGDVSEDFTTADDDRRVWTSFPHPNLYDYNIDGDNNIHDQESKPHLACTDSDGDLAHYVSAFAPLRHDGESQFGSTYLDGFDDGDGDETLLTGRRLPFKESVLRNATSGGSDDPFADALEFYEYFNVSGKKEMQRLVNAVRGRAGHRDYAMKGILNSDPAVVDPPVGQTVPIRSYRKYRKVASQRPAMIYQATHDGVLHAFHAGELESTDNKVEDSEGNEVAAENQREAWAYMPQMLHDEIIDGPDDDDGTDNVREKPELMDGSAIARDVRLCYEKEKYNMNFNACRLHCSSDASSNPDNYTCKDPDTTDKEDPDVETCVPESMRWRSVVVQALGQAGRGYFAMDVSRPGGPHREGTSTDIKEPDPIPLWEFSPAWERAQVKALAEEGYGDRVGSTGALTLGEEKNCGIRKDVTKDGGSLNPKPKHCGTGNAKECEVTVKLKGDDSCQRVYTPGNGDAASESCRKTMEQIREGTVARLGKSISEAGIGSVLMSPLDSDKPNIRRSVAVFGDGKDGGEGVRAQVCDDDTEGTGAIYVVDMQTGSLIRRFTGYTTVDDDDDDNTRKTVGFRHDISGGVKMYPSGTGELASRAFVADSDGNIYRIDFSSPDPADWEVSLMYDPGSEDGGDELFEADDDDEPIAPVTEKPAVAVGENEETGDNPIVVYGLGMPGDRVGEEHHAVVAIEEDDNARDGGIADHLWHLDGSNGLDYDPGEDDGGDPEKMIGEPRIYSGYVYFTTYEQIGQNACSAGSSKIWGLDFDESTGDDLPPGAFDCGDVSIDCKEDGRYVSPDQASVIQGVSIAPPRSCQFDPQETGAKRFAPDASNPPDSGSGPSLIANTGSAESGTDSGVSTEAGGDLNTADVGLGKPESQSIPMSWTVINR